MKVCDATQFFSAIGGGVKRYLTEKQKYVLNHTEDEHVLLIPGDRTGVIRQGRLTVCTVKSPPIPGSTMYRIMMNLQTAQEMIYDQKPDIIESGDPYHLGWRMIEMGEELEIPVVGFYHSHFPEAYLRTVFKYCGPWVRDVGMAYAQDYIEHLYNRFDRTLVPSRFLVEILDEWGVENACPVHLGVDTETFHSEAQPGSRPSGAAADSVVLLYVGRFAGEKNTRVLMEAFRLLHERSPGRYHLMVIGDGPMRGLVRNTQQATGQVTWMKYCQDSRELAGYYRMADLFVHPGVCETFGLVTMESQASGCPVVGIRGSYMDANVFAGLDLWATENTPPALAEAIERMLGADLGALGSLASREVRARFSWPAVFGKMWKIYEDAIEERAYGIRHGGLG